MQNTWTVTLVFLLLELLPFMCEQFSCPLHNFKTAWHIFMKLHTKVKHHEAMCRTHEQLLWLSYFWSYCPMCIYNFRVRSITLRLLNTFSWNFTQTLNIIRQRAEHMSRKWFSYFWSYCPLCVNNFCVCSITFKLLDIFSWVCALTILVSAP